MATFAREDNHDSKVELKWNKGNVFDKDAVVGLYERLLMQKVAKFIAKESSISSRKRPFPLNTVEFQKLGTRKLNMSAENLMKIAEKL